MFKVGEKVTWNGRIPLVNGYASFRFKKRDATITKIDKDATKVNYQISAVNNIGVVLSWWVNKENLSPL